MKELKGKKIMVFGGTSFLGKPTVNFLRDAGANVLAIGHIQGSSYIHSYYGVDFCDLLDKDSTHDMFKRGYIALSGLDYVVHLAGYNGGIKFNLDNPYDVFMQNTIMALNVINNCQYWGVHKVLSTITSCGYPEYEFTHDGSYGDWGSYPREIMKEENYLDGPIHETVACHGYAKRNLLLAGKYAHKQYGLNAVCVCPTTLYGPGDSFDPNKTKVMGAMIRRFLEAKRDNLDKVVCWGTGKPLREFMYVEDAARLIGLSLAKYDDPTMPLNLGSGQELSIKELAKKVASAVEYKGQIEWDTTKPDGQYRKCLDIRKRLEILGETPLVPLDEGIKRTVEWCIKERVI